MADYYNAIQIVDAVSSVVGHRTTMKILKNLADKKTSDVVPVKHGKWEPLVQTIDGARFVGDVCSECGWWKAMGVYNYCPHCGARMDGDPDA